MARGSQQERGSTNKCFLPPLATIRRRRRLDPTAPHSRKLGLLFFLAASEGGGGAGGGGRQGGACSCGRIVDGMHMR